MRRERVKRWMAGAGLAAIAWLPLAGCGERTSEAEGSAGGSVGLFGRARREAPTPRTVPAGTVLFVSLEDGLSSHRSQVGDVFEARVLQGVSLGGLEVVPAGARLVGRVSEATPARKIGGRARLGLEFRTLELPWGERVEIAAAFAGAGRSQAGKDAAIIGAATVGGAILGEAVDEGEGTLIGAIVGGVGGAVAASRTRAKPVELARGAELALELTRDVTVSVPAVAAGGRQAGASR